MASRPLTTRRVVVAAAVRDEAMAWARWLQLQPRQMLPQRNYEKMVWKIKLTLQPLLLQFDLQTLASKCYLWKKAMACDVVVNLEDEGRLSLRGCQDDGGKQAEKVEKEK